MSRAQALAPAAAGPPQRLDPEDGDLLRPGAARLPTALARTPR